MTNYCLMPSEIARLVYDTGCEKTAQCFLEESPYLKEFAHGIKNGFPYSTKPYNQSLLQMLNGQLFCINTFSDAQQPTIMDKQSGSNTYDNTTNFFANHKNLSNQVMVKNFEDKFRSINNDHLCTPKHKILQSRNTNQYSPRRKNTTPKRLMNSNNIPHQQQQTESTHSKQQNVTTVLCGENQQNSQSSPFSSSACESSEIDIEVQPQVIFDELLKYGPLHDKVANTIQKLICDKDNPNNNPDFQPQNNSVKSSEESNLIVNSNCIENKVGNIEKDLLPMDTLVDIIDSLTEEPVFNDFVEMVVEKEIANTPFKSLPNTPGTNSSTSSLNTPNVFLTPINHHKNLPKVVDNSGTIPVKNLLKELNTPEKRFIPSASSTLIDHRVTNYNCEYDEKKSTTTPKSQDNKIDVDYSTKQVSHVSLDRIPKQNSVVESWKTETHVGNQLSKIKPILQNHSFVPKFNRVSNNQKEVQEALNYCPTIDVNQSSNSTSDETKKTLTTTIEVVDEINGDNEEKRTSDGQQQSMQQEQVSNSVELVSLQNWPSTNGLTQQIIIPNNQIAWSNQGLIYLSYPAQETIYYIDQSKVPAVNPTNESVVETNQNESNNDDENEQEIDQSKVATSSPTVHTSSSTRPARIVPSILSKGKQKINSNAENRQLNIQKNSSSNKTNNPSSSTMSTSIDSCNKILSSPIKKEDNSKVLRKKSEFLSRTENNNKRKKSDFDDSIKNKRKLLVAGDQKIKTLLQSDIDSFLANVHKEKK